MAVDVHTAVVLMVLEVERVEAPAVVLAETVWERATKGDCARGSGLI